MFNYYFVSFSYTYNQNKKYAIRKFWTDKTDLEKIKTAFKTVMESELDNVEVLTIRNEREMTGFYL